MTSLRLSGINACVFDAYGTLFDFTSAAAQEKSTLGDQWQALSELWRSKQLQYTWLRSLMNQHADFWQVTGDALDFAMTSLNIDDPALRGRLMSLYLKLNAFPEVKDTLTQLKAQGMKLAILSNGEPKMLKAAIDNAGIADLVDALLSAEQAKIYKPHPDVYRLATDRFGVQADQICFVSSNAWDAHAAKAFGFHVIWCNRFGQVPERIPSPPDGQITTLAALPAIVAKVY